MNLKALVLPFFITGSMSGIYLLPSVGKVAESAVIMELPDSLGRWSLDKKPPTEAEIGTLSKDTRFSKARCLTARPGEVTLDGYLVPDQVDLSVVLSGADINNSIHRPERCMPAQGHNIISSSDQILKLDNGRQFEAKRLLSIQNIPTSEERKEYLKFNCVTYYFFVGHDRVTNDHLARTFIDMKDRLVLGMDQRWAYVSVSMWYGKLPWIEKEVTEAEADSKLKGFLEKFSEQQINWEQISRD